MRLGGQEIESMRSFKRICTRCKKEIRKNYCRECDEFFEEGHGNDCPLAKLTKEHCGHRTY